MQSRLVSTREVSPSALLEQRLRPSRDSVRAWLDQPLGMALAPMPATGARAGPAAILDWMLETQRARAGAQLAAGPVFDLRGGFPADTIRRRDVLRLYPFENTLRSVRITGAQLREYLERSARYFRVDAAGRVSLDDSMPGYDFDVVRGAHYDVDLRRSPGGRITNLSVGGRMVQPSDSFTMAVNSHRQTGAGGYSMVARAPVVYDKGVRIQDLLESEIRRAPLDPASIAPSQWRIVPEVSAVAVREIYDIAPEPLPRSASDTIVFRILGTAGLRGALGSAGAIDRTMDSLQRDCDCPTLRVDAGGAAAGRVGVGVSRRHRLRRLLVRRRPRCRRRLGEDHPLSRTRTADVRRVFRP
jgi:hypothetical protein